MFMTRLEVLSLPDGRWRLTKPLRYEVEPATVITVPTGYETDLASVPRGLWAIFPRDGRYREAAVVHDWIYTDMCNEYTRAEADTIFRHAMAKLGIGAIGRWLMWSAVRIGGRGNW